MRKIKLRGPIICIAVAILLLFVKDNIKVVWDFICLFATALTPIIYGFVIAYIINFPYKFFREKVFTKIGKKHKMWQKIASPFSLVFTYLFVAGIIALLIGFILPELIASITNLTNSLPSYFHQFQTNVNMFIDWIKNSTGLELNGISSFEDLMSTMLKSFTGDDIPGFTQKVVDSLSPLAMGTLTTLYNWLMGIILSIYMITSKKRLCYQIKKITVAFIPIKWLPKIYEVVDVTDNKCGRFIVGKILDSTIIGVLCFVVMSIFSLEYALLISILVAICNIIPFFGPFISAIPSAFLLLMIDPLQSLIFIIIIVILQQIDGNIIGPKIVGDKVGLIGFWSLFSVIIGGALFGFPGLILGTPVFAAIYTLLGKTVKNKIEEKGNIAQQALDFEVLKYTEIASEQKKIRNQGEGHNISKFLQKELSKKKDNKDNKNNKKKKYKYNKTSISDILDEEIIVFHDDHSENKENISENTDEN